MEIVLIVRLLLLASAAAALYLHRRPILEMLEQFNGRGGGPRSPMHPLPARDFVPRRASREAEHVPQNTVRR